MPHLADSSFLWIEDLAYPDRLVDLGFGIPLIGSSLNLLPILMTIITLLSTLTYKNELAPKQEIKRQKVRLYLMAVSFLVLFYPFPAAMVLYWLMANLLQTVQQAL